METDKFGNFFSRVSISRDDGSSGISRFLNSGQNVETTSFRNLRGQVAVGFFVYDTIC